MGSHLGGADYPACCWINAPDYFLRYVVLSRNNLLFETWLAMGGVLAAPIFASSIVAMPLLLDRRSNLLMAVLHQLAGRSRQPRPNGRLGSTDHVAGTHQFSPTAMLGLIPLIPVLGHASWHAYRALVDASASPECPPVRS